VEGVVCAARTVFCFVASVARATLAFRERFFSEQLTAVCRN
jgi:hypothetical protein